MKVKLKHNSAVWELQFVRVNYFFLCSTSKFFLSRLAKAAKELLFYYFVFFQLVVSIFAALQTKLKPFYLFIIL